MSLRKKAFYLGYMAKRLMSSYLGSSTEDDRDHYGKKRIELTGHLMLNLFRELFKQYLSNAQRLLKRLLQSSNKDGGIIENKV
jgi:DNA-directed RNA polymerase II subunit RPB2